MDILIGPSHAVEDKMAWAEEAFVLLKHNAPVGKALGAQLERLRAAVAATRVEMRRSGMVAFCHGCDVDRGGSCCGSGIEDHYDAVTLLVNRLLGVSMPRTRRALCDCYFLSDQGCTLVARHPVCVNYICRPLRERMADDALAEIRRLEGVQLELTAQAEAHAQALLQRLDRDITSEV
jgi:hypothetical protein